MPAALTPPTRGEQALELKPLLRHTHRSLVGAGSWPAQRESTMAWKGERTGLTGLGGSCGQTPRALPSIGVGRNLRRWRAWGFAHEVEAAERGWVGSRGLLPSPWLPSSRRVGSTWSRGRAALSRAASVPSPLPFQTLGGHSTEARLPRGARGPTGAHCDRQKQAVAGANLTFVPFLPRWPRGTRFLVFGCGAVARVGQVASASFPPPAPHLCPCSYCPWGCGRLEGRPGDLLWEAGKAGGGRLCRPRTPLYFSTTIRTE